MEVPESFQLAGLPALPPEARDASDLISAACSSVKTLWASIALAELSFHHIHRLYTGTTNTSDDDAALYDEWIYLAAHSAIDAVFQFHESLAAVCDWVATSPVASALPNPAAAAAANDLFERHFPKWKQMRQATAHRAEIRANRDRNWHTGGSGRGFVKIARGSGMVLSESFEGRTFVTTRKGELLRFDLTAPTYKRLFAVYELLAKGLVEAPVQPQSDQTSHES